MGWDYSAIPLEDPVKLRFWQKFRPHLTVDHHRITLLEAIEAGDIMFAMMECGFTYQIPFMVDNWVKLQEFGMYEKALAYALTCVIHRHRFNCFNFISKR